jgi:hypothetical protein
MESDGDSLQLRPDDVLGELQFHLLPRFLHWRGVGTVDFLGGFEGGIVVRVDVSVLLGKLEGRSIGVLQVLVL